MNKPRIIIGILLVLGLMAGLAVGDAVRDELERMDTSSFESPRRPGAVFSHDDHNAVAELEEDCALCHHLYEDGRLVADESSEDQLCSDCHGLKSTPDNGISLEVAYHKRCRECHFDRAKGPVLCGECHVKK